MGEARKIAGVYREGGESVFSSGGRRYRLDDILAQVEADPVRPFEVAALRWLLEVVRLDEDRVAAADVMAPVLVTEEAGRWLVVDGLHRLARAVSVGLEMLPGRYVAPEVLDKVRLPD